MGVTITAAYTIRDAVPGDAAALSRLKLATFREAFLEDHAIPYPAADLVTFEADTYGPDRVTAELADPTHRTWVVDGADGELVAYAHVGPCKLPNDDVRPGDWEIYQLYLRRQVQGSGLGSRLLAHVLDWLADPEQPGLAGGVVGQSPRAGTLSALGLRRGRRTSLSRRHLGG